MPSCGVCLSVCVSVRPSVTYVNSVKMNKHIFKMFPPPSGQAILVFPYQTAWQYSDGNPSPLTGASNAGGVGKNIDSQRIYGFAIGNCCTVVSLWHLAAGILLTAGIGRPSAMRYKQLRLPVTVCVQCETALGRALAVHSHGQPCV